MNWKRRKAIRTWLSGRCSPSRSRFQSRSRNFIAFFNVAQFRGMKFRRLYNMKYNLRAVVAILREPQYRRLSSKPSIGVSFFALEIPANLLYFCIDAPSPVFRTLRFQSTRVQLFCPFLFTLIFHSNIRTRQDAHFTEGHFMISKVVRNCVVKLTISKVVSSVLNILRTVHYEQ